MRAEINENGQLSVIPETPLEIFALRVWWEDWDAQINNPEYVRQPFSTLRIQTIAEKLPDHDGLEV